MKKLLILSLLGAFAINNVDLAAMKRKREYYEENQPPLKKQKIKNDEGKTTTNSTSFFGNLMTFFTKTFFTRGSSFTSNIQPSENSNYTEIDNSKIEADIRERMQSIKELRAKKENAEALFLEWTNRKEADDTKLKTNKTLTTIQKKQLLQAIKTKNGLINTNLTTIETIEKKISTLEAQLNELKNQYPNIFETIEDEELDEKINQLTKESSHNNN